jgi:hypothetical protein
VVRNTRQVRPWSLSSRIVSTTPALPVLVLAQGSEPFLARSAELTALTTIASSDEPAFSWTEPVVIERSSFSKRLKASILLVQPESSITRHVTSKAVVLIMITKNVPTHAADEDTCH